MTERERLIELIMNTPKIPITVCGRAQGKTYQTAKNVADHLLANGVIVLDTDHVKTAIRKTIPQFVLCPKGWEGFARTRYYCPSCKKMTREHEKFCHNCGQAVKYPKLARSETNNKLILDWSDTK